MTDLKNNHADMAERALEMMQPEACEEMQHTPLDDLSRRRIQEDLLSKLSNSTARQKQKRFVMIAVAALAVLSMLPVIYYFMTPSPPVETHLVQSSSTGTAATNTAEMFTIPGSYLIALGGEAFSDFKKLPSGTAVPVARQLAIKDSEMAFSLPTGIGVGMAAGTQMRVLWGGHSHYGVMMTHGMALFSIDPGKKRDEFFVETPTGTFQVRGTLFTVVVSSVNDVYIQLHRGKVHWVPRNGETVSLPSGALFKTSDSAASVVSDGRLTTMIARQMERFQQEPAGTLFTELSNAPIRDTSSSLPTPAENESRGASKSMSLKELMATAKRQKSQAKWRKAANTYRKVIQKYPLSPEAETSRMSLGQLLLNRLNSPRAAIGQFSTYLQRSGPLQQEALYGTAMAYQKLGDRRNERLTWITLRQRFPSGLYARVAHDRLLVINGE